MPDFPNPFANKTNGELEDMDHGVADLLCWTQGFLAAYEGEHAPLSINHVRDLRRILIKEIEARKSAS